MKLLLQQLAVESNSEEVGAVVVGDIAVLDDEMKPISVASVGKCGPFGGKLMHDYISSKRIVAIAQGAPRHQSICLVGSFCRCPSLSSSFLVRWKYVLNATKSRL